MTSKDTPTQRFSRAALPQVENRTQRFARAVIRLRWFVVVASLAALAAAGFGATKLAFTTDYSNFFRAENPLLQSFQALQRTFTKQDNLLVAVQAPEGSAFSPKALSAVAELTAGAWKLPNAIRVDSLANFQHTYAEDDDLIVEDLAKKPEDFAAADFERVRRVALAEPLLAGRLVAKDGRTTAVNVTFQFPGESESETPIVIAAARALVAEVAERHPDLRFATTGIVALNNAFTEAIQVDAVTLFPVMYGMLILTMALFFRSAAAVVVTVLVISLSNVGAFGLAGWLGITLTPPSVSAFTVLLTVAIADSVHILVTFLQALGAGRPRDEAIVESLRVNMQPVFLTSLTTVIGFLSLNFSETPPFQDFGNITAMGVVVAWLLSIFLLPALLAVIPFRTKGLARGRGLGMERMAEVVVTHRGRLLWVGVAVVAGAAALIPRIELNDQFVRYFDPKIEFRRDTDFVSENLAGLYLLHYSVPAAGEGGISDPEYLARLDRFAEWLRAYPKVDHVSVFSDVMRRLNKNMHGDEPDWYRLPEERELAAQYLLLYEMSLPYGLDLNDQISVDKSATRVTATLNGVSSTEMRQIYHDSKDWFAANAPEGLGAEATGPSLMFSFSSQANMRAMMIGTAIALALITLVLTVALRSLSLGFLSVLPNVVPAVIAFGIWAVYRGDLSMAGSVVVSSSIGIIVDDTVHFLSKYMRAKREMKSSSEDAVRYAFATVGPALMVTTFVLAAGFVVIANSAFELNATMGALFGLIITSALVADLLLLPPVLMAFDKRRTHEESNTVEASVAA